MKGKKSRKSDNYIRTLPKFSSPEKITFTKLFEALFKEAESLPDYKGLLTVSMIFEMANFFGSLVKWSPLKGKLEANRKIIDKDKFAEWFVTGEEPGKRGCRVVSVGVGLDRKYAGQFPEESLDRIFYLHPANIGAVTKQLHNHCFIFNPGDLPQELHDYNAEVSKLLQNSEIFDIKHILDNTTLTEGFAAVNVVEKIEECVFNS